MLKLSVKGMAFIYPAGINKNKRGIAPALALVWITYLAVIVFVRLAACIGMAFAVAMPTAASFLACWPP
jgi:hypothetical protein